MPLPDNGIYSSLLHDDKNTKPPFISHVETIIGYGKYLILEGKYPHIGFGIDMLADGNIHNMAHFK